MIGVIDVGGGLRDIYGAAIFDYCIDNNIEFDCCIGVSAGSANMASYLGRQKKRNYTYYTEYAFRKEYMCLGNFIKKGSYLDLDYVYSELSNKGKEYPLNYDNIAASKSMFKVVALDALTGKPKYFDKSDMAQDRYDILKASSAIPAVCKPYVVDGVPYYDGGAADPIPIEYAFSLGCDKVVLILTRPTTYKREQKKDNLPAKMIRKKYPKAAESLLQRYQMYNDGVELALKYEKEGKMLILAPDEASCEGIGTLTKDIARLNKLYEKGYEDAEKLVNFMK